MFNDPLTDSRLLGAQTPLKRWFDTVDRSGLEPFQIEQLLDLVDLTAKLLDYVWEANGWSEGQVIQKDAAWTAIRQVDGLSFVERAKIDLKFTKYAKDSGMLISVRNLAVLALTGAI